MCNKGYSTWFVCLCVSVTMFSTTRCNQTAKKLYKQTDLALDLKLALFVMNVTVTLAAHACRGLKTVHSKVSEHANNMHGLPQLRFRPCCALSGGRTSLRSNVRTT